MQSNDPAVGKPIWDSVIGKSFVPALITYREPYVTDEGEERGWVTSGFVVELEGKWFWITAQHSLDAMEERLKKWPDIAPQFRPLTDDRTAEIFFAYEEDHRLDWAKTSLQMLETPTLTQDEKEAHEFFSQLDIGALALTELCVRNLAAAGVVPLTQNDAWLLEQHEITPEKIAAAKFGVAGIPANEILVDDNGRPKKWAYKTLPLDLVKAEGPVWRFSPQWSDDLHVGSVKGMSGGPIFVLFDGGIFWCGVQSSQELSGERPTTLYGCPNRHVLELLSRIAEKIEEWRKASEAANGNPT